MSQVGDKKREVFNVNDVVWVKLTPDGLAHLKARHDKLNEFTRGFLGEFKPPAVDEEGWSKMQLWCLMADLGGAISLGAPAPFETAIEFERLT